MTTVQVKESKKGGDMVSKIHPLREDCDLFLDEKEV